MADFFFLLSSKGLVFLSFGITYQKMKTPARLSALLYASDYLCQCRNKLNAEMVFDSGN
jgi:hypothetical protein